MGNFIECVRDRIIDLYRGIGHRPWRGAFERDFCQTGSENCDPWRKRL